jgi:hypothetical protein
MMPEEAFHLMETKFAKTNVGDIIDLCYNDRRFPAVVSHIDHLNRNFSVIEIDAQKAEELLNNNSMEEIFVQLPSSMEDQRPAWNIVGK